MRKRIAIAVLLSLLIPGMGQLFNRQPRKGLWMAVTFPFLALIAGESRILLSFWGVVILAVVIVAWRLFIIADAVHIACVDSKTERGFRNSRITVFFIAGIILLAAFLPTPGQFLGRYTYFRAFRLPSDSMCPTACQGERLIANMDAFKTKPPQRGDIIIFDYDSASTKEIYIKRVIAVAVGARSRSHSLNPKARSLEIGPSRGFRIPFGGAAARDGNQEVEVVQADSCLDRIIDWLERADLVGQVCGSLRRSQGKRVRTGLPSYSCHFDGLSSFL